MHMWLNLRMQPIFPLSKCIDANKIPNLLFILFKSLKYAFRLAKLWTTDTHEITPIPTCRSAHGKITLAVWELLHINHRKEVYMANILPEVKGSMIRYIHHLIMVHMIYLILWCFSILTPVKLSLASIRVVASCQEAVASVQPCVVQHTK